jgi:hypothetical protein
MSQVNAELSFSPTATISFNDSSVRTLTGTSPGTTLVLPTGFYGKASSVTFSTYWVIGGGPYEVDYSVHPGTWTWDQFTGPTGGGNDYYNAWYADNSGSYPGSHPQTFKGVDFAVNLTTLDGSYTYGFTYITGVVVFTVGTHSPTWATSLTFPSGSGWGGGYPTQYVFPFASATRYDQPAYNPSGPFSSFQWGVGSPNHWFFTNPGDGSDVYRSIIMA